LTASAPAESGAAPLRGRRKTAEAAPGPSLAPVIKPVVKAKRADQAAGRWRLCALVVFWVVIGRSMPYMMRAM